MKNLLLALILPMSVNAAIMTSSADSLFKISPKCEDPSLQKKTIFLVDYTVDNKTALATNLKSIEGSLNSIYNSDQKEYLLNHKFEFAVIDSSGEHSSEWKVITPKEFGSRFSKLNYALAELNTKIDQSISSIKGDTKKYNSSLLLEQISIYGRNLEACDNLFVLSDFMLVDREGNNFERDKFLTPAELELKKGHVALLRVERTGLTLKIIQKVERWWEQALNGGDPFTSRYAISKPETKREVSSEPKKEVAIVPDVPSVESVPLVLEDEPTEALIPTKPFLSPEPKVELPSDNAKPEDDEDDFSDIGIAHVPVQQIQVPLTPPAPPKVSESLLQLSCDEFTSRVKSEAFKTCSIYKNDLQSSKLEVSLNEQGRITSYESPWALSETKRFCLSGYVASKPPRDVGASFTCRVVINN